MNDIFEGLIELLLSVPLAVSLSGLALFYILVTRPLIGYVKRTIWRTVFGISVWSFGGVGVISTIAGMVNFAIFH